MLIKTFPRPDSSLIPANATEAIAIQKDLRHKVSLKNGFNNMELIAGVDCSYDIKNNLSRAVIVLMKIDDLKPLESIMALMPITFPYIPGLLSFREIPVIMAALSHLSQKPDILMVDGQGIAHPRRLGIASHLGVLTGIASVGVAKSRLIGKFEEPGKDKGSVAELYDKGEKIGHVLRSKINTKPLFVSPGHMIDHETALGLVLKCLVNYRLPQPTHIADKLSKTKNLIG
jgi:deoxyribonuclease V